MSNLKNVAMAVGGTYVTAKVAVKKVIHAGNRFEKKLAKTVEEHLYKVIKFKKSAIKFIEVADVGANSDGLTVFVVLTLNGTYRGQDSIFIHATRSGESYEVEVSGRNYSSRTDVKILSKKSVHVDAFGIDYIVDYINALTSKLAKEVKKA